MHYKYKTEIVLEGKIEIVMVNRSIRSVLKEYKTDKFATIDNKVKFKNYNFKKRGRLNIEYMSLVDNGTLTVNIEEDKTKIFLEAYSSLWGCFIFFAFFCVTSFAYKDFSAVFMFLIFISIVFYINYLIISKGSIAMLSKVKEKIENEILLIQNTIK
jgi:hypothetical protein